MTKKQTSAPAGESSPGPASGQYQVTRALLDVDKIKVPSTRITSYFDNETYAQFQASIKQLGLLGDILVVQTGEVFFLVDGLHRLQELQHNGVRQVPATVIQGDERDVFLTNIIMNLLHGKPKIKEVREVIGVLYNDYQMGTDQIAEETGMSVHFVDDLLLISKLPDQVLEAFDNGELEKGKALALTKLTSADQQLYMFEALRGKRLSVHDWESYIVDVARMRSEAVPAVQPPAPAVPLKRPCDICNTEHELKWLQTVFICPECLAAARQSYAIAIAEVQKEQAAARAPLGG